MGAEDLVLAPLAEDVVLRPAGEEAFDPDLAALAGRQLIDAPPLARTPLAEVRERLVRGHRLCADGPADVQVGHHQVPGPAGPLTLRVYTPPSTMGSPRVTVVYVHGGGWTTGDLDHGDELCRFVSREARARVVSVDYRLAPEHPYPAPLDDVHAALVHVLASERTPAHPVGVMGDSAGGNLLAAAMLRLRGTQLMPDFQAFAYPVTGADLDTHSYQACARSWPLGRDAMQFFFDQYLGTGRVHEFARDPEVAPAVADLSGLPPAVVAVAGHDPLHDDGTDWAARLTRSGVPVVLAQEPHLCHGYLRFTSASSGCLRARDRFVAHVTDLIARVTPG